MPTLREYLASLPPEEQASAMEQIQRNIARQRNITEHPVLGRLKELGVGALAGIGNAAQHASQLPFEVTNALGLTDYANPSKPLIGPGGEHLSDPSLGLGVGPYYGVGNVAGFAVSFLTGGGEAKAGAGLVRRAIEGAVHLATGTALRSQGTLQDRIVAGVEAAPLGAAFGVAAKARAAGEGLGKYIFKTSVKSGVAGAVVPGHAPVEATGIPVVDNFLFNAAFGAVASIRAKEPVVPGREPTQTTSRAAANTAADLRARAGDMQRSVEDQASLESAIATQFPPQPTRGQGGQNLFGETQGQQRALFEPSVMEPGTLIPDAAQKALFEQAQAAVPETKPEDIFAKSALPDSELPSAKSVIDKVRNALSKIHTQLIDGLSVDAYHLKGKPAPARAVEARATIEQHVRALLSSTPKAAWNPYKQLRVIIAAPRASDPTNVDYGAMLFTTLNTLVLPPDFFKRSLIKKGTTLIHEAVHEASMNRRAKSLSVDEIAASLEKAGMPATSFDTRKGDADDLNTAVTALGHRVAVAYFPDAQLLDVVPNIADRNGSGTLGTIHLRSGIRVFSIPFGNRTEKLVTPDSRTGTHPSHYTHRLLTGSVDHILLEQRTLDGLGFGRPTMGVNDDVNQGGFYAYSHPAEYIAEMGADRALLSPTEFTNKHGLAGVELMNKMNGPAEDTFVAGTSAARYSRQRALLDKDFPAQSGIELGGPTNMTLEWRPLNKDFFDELGVADFANARKSVEEERPWQLAAIAQADKVKRLDDPESYEIRTLGDKVADAQMSKYLSISKRYDAARDAKALFDIQTRIRSLFHERTEVLDAAGAKRGEEIGHKELRSVVSFKDVKAIVDEVMGETAARVTDFGTTEGGKIKTVEDIAVQGETDFTKLAAGTTKKVKRAVSSTEFSSIFTEKEDPVRKARLDSLFVDGIVGVMGNRDLSKPLKEMLIRRFGYLYTNPDGSPVHPRRESIPEIAGKTGTSERNVRARIQAFAGSGLSARRVLAKGEAPLFEGVRPATRLEDLPGPPNNLVRGGEVIPADDPTYDYIVWKNKQAQYNRETGKIELTKTFSRRGTGRATITDLRTGQKEVQQGLFDDRRAAYAEADREAQVPEPPAGPPPEPISQQEKVMEASLGEAVSGPLATSILKGHEAADAKARRQGVQSKQPEILSLFGEIKGAIKPTSRLGEFATFEKARQRIGSSAMTPEQFASLHIDQQLRHVILRLTGAANTTHYTKTLAKYAKLLNASATENGARVQFPTLTKLVEASKAAKKGLPRVGWMGVINDRAAELGVTIDQVNPEAGSGAKLRLTEPETGRQIVTRDVGTAALFLDARSRRIAEAVDLMPPGFSHIRMYLDPAGGAPFGPPPPADTPTAPDAEAGGRPPDMPSGAERSFGDAFFSQVRPTLNAAASLARKLGYNEAALATYNLMDAMESGRNAAQRTIQHRIDLVKKFRISVRRQGVLGKAAADLDIAGENELKATEDLDKAILRMDTIQDAVYEAHGLSPNEISFLKKMRPEWDRMFRLFNIGVTKYIPGYFTRWGRRDPENGTVVLNATHTTDVDFFARQYRKGHLRGQNYNYFEVFDHYARQGFREKHVGASPGAGQLSPIERLDSVLQRYALRSVGGQSVPWVDLTDDAGTATGRIAKQFDPLVRLISAARGIPDPRRLNAVEAQSGVYKRLYDLTDEKQQAAIDRAFVPFRKELKSTVRSVHEALGVKLSERTYDTWLDVFTRLSRGRTFGLAFGKALRNMITDGPFATLPRVGPKYYGQAISDLLNPSLGPQIYRRAVANNVIKPSFVTEYISTTNRALTAIEKLSFMFSLSDHWGRAVAFRAQELKTRDAALAYTKHADIEKFKHDSGLTLLDPAWHDLVVQPLQRGNFQVAIREHAKLLSTVALFDYTNANAPIAFRGVWGRFLGQYAIWPINMIESLHGMVKWGTREERLKQAALYAASAAAVYGAGSAIGVKTSQWIPFVNNVFYTGGPGLGLAEETREALAGDPATQQRLISDLHHDPIAFFLGAVTKNILPAGDVLRVLAAQTNMSRRRRRLLGIPRPESSPNARIKRLLGFIPASAPEPKTQPLIQRLTSEATKNLP